MRRTQVHFDRPIRAWDGFGMNYVEAAQTRDYGQDPQEYGGFSTLTPEDQEQILELIFGDDGLKPGVVKMFLDPFHQAEPGPGYNWDPHVIDPDAYDHTQTTHWMRSFVREGLKRTRARGDDLSILTTLYGPPAWMTKQRILRGRDLDPRYKHELAKYVVSWAAYLRDVEGFPVRYVGLHNEGEDWMRWPLDGSTAGTPNHDYNMYWPPELVAEHVALMRALLDAQGMHDVGVAPGETSNWYRFCEWGYADALADSDEAMRALGLVTSHGFYGTKPRWFGDWRSVGIDLLRAKRPDLHAWVTSTSWSKMDALFVWEMHNNIYSAKVNAIIPWAGVQRTTKWVGGDPNPGTAIRVDDEGRWRVEPGYHYYKQVCRAGQPGMAVARVRSNDSQISLIAFANNGTKHPDAFVIINVSDEDVDLEVEVAGSRNTRFQGYRTDPGQEYAPLGEMALSRDRLAYRSTAGSVTTFFGLDV